MTVERRGILSSGYRATLNVAHSITSATQTVADVVEVSSAVTSQSVLIMASLALHELRVKAEASGSKMLTYDDIYAMNHRD